MMETAEVVGLEGRETGAESRAGGGFGFDFAEEAWEIGG